MKKLISIGLIFLTLLSCISNYKDKDKDKMTSNNQNKIIVKSKEESAIKVLKDTLDNDEKETLNFFVSALFERLSMNHGISNYLRNVENKNKDKDITVMEEYVDKFLLQLSIDDTKELLAKIKETNDDLDHIGGLIAFKRALANAFDLFFSKTIEPSLDRKVTRVFNALHAACEWHKNTK